MVLAFFSQWGCFIDWGCLTKWGRIMDWGCLTDWKCFNRSRWPHGLSLPINWDHLTNWGCVMAWDCCTDEGFLTDRDYLIDLGSLTYFGCLSKWVLSQELRLPKDWGFPKIEANCWIEIVSRIEASLWFRAELPHSMRLPQTLRYNWERL